MGISNHLLWRFGYQLVFILFSQTLTHLSQPTGERLSYFVMVICMGSVPTPLSQLKYLVGSIQDITRHVFLNITVANKRPGLSTIVTPPQHKR